MSLQECFYGNMYIHVSPNRIMVRNYIRDFLKSLVKGDQRNKVLLVIVIVELTLLCPLITGFVVGIWIPTRTITEFTRNTM